MMKQGELSTDKEGTASLADVHGYYQGGKPGTSQNYKFKNENLKNITFYFSKFTRSLDMPYW